MFAVGREAVEAFVAFVFFAPLTRQKALRFKPTEKRVKCAFVDFKPMFGKFFAECVALVLLLELGEDGQSEAATSELKTKVFEGGLSYGHVVPRYRCATYTVLHILYDK